MPVSSPVLLGAVIATALFCIWFAAIGARWLRAPSASERRHARKVRSAATALATVNRIGPRANPARVFGYLRKVDPYVFEEMILTELERRGHAIKRNRRYSGDGGADGAFVLNGRRWLIQAKRYRGPVRTADILSFDTLCRQLGARGLFVHTGKTTTVGRDSATDSGFIRIVSGGDLVAFLAGDSLRLAPGARDRRSPLPHNHHEDANL